jgi:hypothetical protein
MRKLDITLLLAMAVCVLATNAFALSIETHRALNTQLAITSYNEFSLDTYLKNNAGFAAGIGLSLAGRRGGTHRVTHLKGTVKRKQLSCGEKRNVSRRALPLSSSSPLPQFHSFGVSLHCTSHPSGSRSSVLLLHDPFPRRGTRKSSAPCRVQ